MQERTSAVGAGDSVSKLSIQGVVRGEKLPKYMHPGIILRGPLLEVVPESIKIGSICANGSFDAEIAH